MHRFLSIQGKFIILFNLGIIVAKNSSSQYYYYNDKYYNNGVLIEIGGSFGGINCLTDLGGKKGVGKKFIKDINWNNTQTCAGIYAGVLIKDIFALRLEGCFGNVMAYDSILSKYKDDLATKGRYYRNLNFRSKISEISLVAEFHPLMLLDYSDRPPPLFSPYILAGIGRFQFEPQTYFQGKWINLEPLRLEGQGFAEYRDRDLYETKAISFPVGLGIRYEINEFFAARFELSHRFTNTDYLDDVSKGSYIDPSLFPKYLNSTNAFLASQLYDRHAALNPNYIPDKNEIRGKSANNDSWFTFSLKLGFTLGRQSIK